jgi:hypothetical protein
MGFCFSCCRRQKSPEQEPLLPKDCADTEPPRYDEILADVIAAISVGKLPSQAQLDYAARIILNSQILNVEDAKSSGRGAISHSWRRILKDIREIIEASIEIGLQKNGKSAIAPLRFSSCYKAKDL